MMECRLVSCLEKIFPDGRGVSAPLPPLSALQGESIAFQCAIFCEYYTYVFPRIQGNLPGKATIHHVECVPARMGRKEQDSDENYLSLAPDFYPDLLIPVQGGVACPGNAWKALFIEIETDENAPAGEYTFSLQLPGTVPITEENVIQEISVTMEVIGAKLPAQQISHTEWFHSDCLADFYHVPAFSERHWEIIGNFMETAARRGCTMILTPHFTPPLDTRQGGERTTVQLVDVEDTGEQYRFEFTKLKRWIDLAFEKGFSRIEFAHLFTQWGAKAAPKIMGMKDGVYQRLFGWDTPAVGGEYTRFLNAYLPCLTQKLREWGIADKCCFHISDEPTVAQLDSYLAARQSVDQLLSGFPVIDALSDVNLAKECRISPPIACAHHLDAFFSENISPLWGYYCCGPDKDYTNRFLYMSLSRTRSMGMQWWKYDLKGFLHWGFNFYNTAHSVAPINPFLDTEAGGIFPAGDSFLVYPGMDGKPLESLRLIAMHYAMQDARALSLLAQLKGRDFALALLEEAFPLTLTCYPNDSQSFLAIRSRINAAIREQVTK